MRSKPIRTMVFEEMVVKTVAPTQGQVAAFAAGTHLNVVEGQRMARLAKGPALSG
jgi:hypothetical protein